MTTPWPARFSDVHGTALTSIRIDDGHQMRLRIRGFDFAGQPHTLEPVLPLPPQAPFARSAQGAVCNYTLEWRVPVLLDRAAGSQLSGYLHLRLDEADGGIAAVLEADGTEYRSRWIQDRLDEALMDVRQQLPEGLRLRMCHSCGLAEYHDYAYGPFGDLACFRDTPDEVRARPVRLGSLWQRRTEFVPETHLCPQFEPGGGRGGAGRGEPNTWAVPEWSEPTA
jgi:hypothetical protein